MARLVTIKSKRVQVMVGPPESLMPLLEHLAIVTGSTVRDDDPAGHRMQLELDGQVIAWVQALDG